MFNLNQIESILFVASQALSLKKIAKILDSTEVEVETAVKQLMEKFNKSDSGINIIFTGDTVQMVSQPENSKIVEQFVKAEITGELTRAQLETLTVIAYRGPITRPELEQIRGVNCVIILRNLLLRGLITEEDSENQIVPVYKLSADTLRQLGITSQGELPDYAELSSHEYIRQALEKTEEKEQ